MTAVNQIRENIYFRRLISAIGWNIVVQGILTFFFVFVLNADIFNPISWASNVFTNVFNFRSFPNLFSITFITLFQGIIYGRRYMNTPGKYFKRINALLNLFSYDNILFCLLYSLAGYLSIRLYSSLSEDSVDLRKVCLKFEGCQCLQEDNLFYQMGGVWIGLYYFSKNNVFRVNVLQFPHIHQDKMLQLKIATYNVFFKGFEKAVTLAGYHIIFYILLGGSFRARVIEAFGLYLEDEPLDTFKILLTLKVFRLWLYFSLICISVQMFELTFNVVLTEPANFAINTKRGLALHQALDQNSLYVSLLATQDLKLIAMKDRQRRRELFSLSLPGGHPHNWRNVLKQCIKIIDDFDKQTEDLIMMKTVDCNTQRNFNNPVINSVKSSSIRPIYNNDLAQSMQKTRDAQVVVDKNVKESIDINLKALIELPGIHYFFGEIPQWRLKYLLTHSQPVIWSCESLAHLSAASLSEDCYGIVQNDLPLIITKLVHLKQSLDKLSKVGLFSRKQDYSNSFNSQMKVALSSGIKRSIYRIVISFFKHIDDIGLSSEVRSILEPFVQFREV